MIKRGLLLATGLGAAVGVPMLLSGGEDGKPGMVSRLWNNIAGSEQPADSAVASSGANSLSRIVPAGQDSAAAAQYPPGFVPPEMQGPRIDGHPVFDPGDVFRFDVSPAWVAGRWARITTVSLPPDMQGYRVPLVTGPSEHDLAGSLTYYFNAKQEVQRITFVGTTGDPASLVALVTKRFRFVAVPSTVPGEYLYQIRWHNVPRSELRLSMAGIVRADSPYQRFDVDLEINLPDVPPSRPLTGSPPLKAS